MILEIDVFVVDVVVLKMKFDVFKVVMKEVCVKEKEII